LKVPMLVGAPFAKKVAGTIHYFNSAFLVDGQMLRYRYDKIHLVPFGEYMPLTWLLPLGPGIAAREADYSPGDTMTVMHAKGCPPFSVLICYEAIFPDLARLAVRNGASMLVNMTNDGWFGDTAAPYQHLAMAGLRSIENRVWLIRCANTGISAAFDPAGRMVKSIPLEHEGFFTVRVPSSLNPGSFYSRFGDVFAWGCIVGIVILILWAAVARPHRP
jgi:apolipoprotein N-acyltransferase